MGRTVFLTGASGGLGEGMARAFARRGCALVLTARRTDVLERLVPELKQAGSPNVLVRRLDVTDYASVPSVLREADQAAGGLDVVIANSGIGGAGPAGQGTFENARQVIETNLIGAMATVDAALELLLPRGKGQIVGVTSVAGVRGLPGQGAYSASKSGLTRYLESVRAEVQGKGLVVTDLAPGFIDTDINRHMKSRPFVVSAEKGTEEMVARIEAGVGFSYVPWFPWTLVAMAMKALPARLLASSR